MWHLKGTIPKPFFLKDKKASSITEFSLVHLLGILLEIGIVTILFYLSIKIIVGLLIGRQDYDSTINNLEALSARISQLVNDKRNIVQDTMSYSISDGYVLVGFNHYDTGVMKTECTDELIIKSRSKECSTKSCLCIYKNFGGVSYEDFDKRGAVTPLKCQTFDEKIVFLSITSESNFKGAKTIWKPNHYNSDYRHLVLYGRCGGLLRNSWGVKEAYLEKYYDGNNIFVFIGDNSNPEIIKRSADIKNIILNSKRI